MKEFKRETNAIELWKVDVVNLAMKNWEKPSSTDKEISTEIAVMVDNTGKLLNLSWVKRTNNKTVDRSIVNAFKKRQCAKIVLSQIFDPEKNIPYKNYEAI